MPPAYVLCFVPIPIFELFTSTFRRLRDGKSPLFADSGHFHHALGCAGLGLVAYFDGTPEWVVFFGFVALYVVWLSFIRLSPTIGRLLPLRMRRDIRNRHV